MVYIWAVRAEVVDASGAVIDASDFHDMRWLPGPTGYSLGGSPGVKVLAGDNSSWLPSQWLDGVQIVHDISGDGFDADALDADAFDVLMENACEWLHDFEDPKRCLVEEVAAAFGGDLESGTTAYDEGMFVPSEMLDRMESGDRWGDGVMGTYLPMEVEHVSAQKGRFGAKQPLDPSYDLLLYEPRLTRSLVGETHEYTTVVPNDPDCEGTWTADWKVEAEANAPLLDWHIKQFDSTGAQKDEDGGRVQIPDGESAPYVELGTHDFEHVYAGHTFAFGWEGLGGGAAMRDANDVQLTLTPPATCPTSSWDPTVDWVHGASLAEPMVEDAYDCVVGFFDGTPSACGP